VAGECVTITCNNLVNNGEVWIKPPTGVTECECKDNWTVYKDSVPACSEVGCGTEDGFYPGLVTGSCTAAVPDPLYEDSAYVSLDWAWVASGNNEGTTPLTYLANSADCTTTPLGWYYLDVSGVTYFALCNNGASSACSQVKSASYSSSKVFVGLDNQACDTPGQYSETSFANTYGDTSDTSSACGADQGIQWGYLSFEGTIPSDAALEFRFVVAQTADDLPTSTDPSSLEWQSAAIATRFNPDESCAIGSGCEINLFDELGGLPDAQVPFLAVLLTLVPSSDGLEAPAVDGWEIRYSCPDNQ
jgi:hypothetical protein